MMNRWDDDFGFGRSSFGVMDSMMRRMERMMQRFDTINDEDANVWPSPIDGAESSSYSCSSSSYSELGMSGRPSYSHSSSRSIRRVGGITEEKSHYHDSNGNERTTNKRGLANQMREVVTDRNGRGEERKVENLRGIQPNELQQFEAEWTQQAKDKFNAKHKVIGHTSPKPLLPAGTTTAPAQITSEKRDVPPSASDSVTQPKADHHPTTPPRRSGRSNTAA